jgi:hypothetical protein
VEGSRNYDKAMEGGNVTATITDKRMEPFTSDERLVWALESAATRASPFLWRPGILGNCIS